MDTDSELKTNTSFKRKYEDISSETETEDFTSTKSPVQEQTSDSTGGEEEEEVIVYVAFPDFNRSDFIRKAPRIEFDFESLFSSKPKCTIHGHEFTARHELALGTKLFFNASNSSFIQLSNRVIHFKLTKLVEPLQSENQSNNDIPVSINNDRNQVVEDSVHINR